MHPPATNPAHAAARLAGWGSCHAFQILATPKFLPLPNPKYVSGVERVGEQFPKQGATWFIVAI